MATEEDVVEEVVEVVTVIFSHRTSPSIYFLFVGSFFSSHLEALGNPKRF